MSLFFSHCIVSPIQHSKVKEKYKGIKFEKEESKLLSADTYYLCRILKNPTDELLKL